MPGAKDYFYALHEGRKNTLKLQFRESHGGSENAQPTGLQQSPLEYAWGNPLYFHPSHSHSILTQEAYVSIPYSTKHVKTDDSCTALKACFCRSQPYANWREASSWWGKTQQCPIPEHMLRCHKKHRTKYKYQTMLHHWSWASQVRCSIIVSGIAPLNESFLTQIS